MTEESRDDGKVVVHVGDTGVALMIVHLILTVFVLLLLILPHFKK